MNSRAFTLSLVIALIAMFMVDQYIEDVETKFVKDYGNMVSVVVASGDIKELELIDDRKIETINVPKKYKMPGAFNKKEDLYNTIASTPIKKGEQITKPRVTYPGTRSGLSRQISVGKRAMSVSINSQSAISKLLKPGDRVDVMALIDYANGRKERMKVKTVLQDVYVLATGLRVTKDIPLVGLRVDKEIKRMKLNNYTNFNTVTLELSPHEVQKLTFLVRTGGGIYLSLRNNDDKKIENVKGTRLYDVLGESDAAEARLYFAEQAERNKKK